MLLQCRQSALRIGLACLLPALVVSLDLNDVDKSLNPRLVGMMFNLYRPSESTNKKPPIVVDCDHPGVLCQFGGSNRPLVARPISECNCKDQVPIVTGLQPDEETGGAGEAGETVSPKTPGASTDDVPIYKGIVSNMEAVLASGAAQATLQYTPSEKLADRWKPPVASNPEDLYQKRFGEIPKKFASYYPFSKPVLIDDPDEFDPDFDQGPPFPFFPEMFGPHHKHHHQFHPFKNKQNGQGSKPSSTWRQTAKPTSPTTTKKPAKVDPTTPAPPNTASGSAKKT
ncbi:hypothetical protein LSTR_LSTR012364 [Laodelphax striatellus]|uniref:Uncharacterized protein n=1 Tax=Laodelphax striatellus TaxID=195883 RepID=A0A482WKI6_LAOST|nr:hypothetical protein LSTR_LSTR012364 [Laodelphax striatellus]